MPRTLLLVVFAALLASPGFAAECPPGVFPSPEICNGVDDDCDGVIDEQEPPDPALCANEEACVLHQEEPQCAAFCRYGDFPCPAGFLCEEVRYSGAQEHAGNRCVLDFDCRCTTISDDAGAATCAPEGWPIAANNPLPACIFGPRCQDPCKDVLCPEDSVCARAGAHIGRCVADSCYRSPCPIGRTCREGACVDNPCRHRPCWPYQVCRPDPTFKKYACYESCADVSCDSTERCHDGECVPWCAASCSAGSVCAPPGECVVNSCLAQECEDGRACDSRTGECVEPACSGIVCPWGQRCRDGECEYAPCPNPEPGPEPDADAPEAAVVDATGEDTIAPDVLDASFDAPRTDARRAVDLVGGSDCQCAVGPGARSTSVAAWILGFALAWWLRMRRT